MIVFRFRVYDGNHIRQKKALDNMLGETKSVHDLTLALFCQKNCIGFSCMSPHFLLLIMHNRLGFGALVNLRSYNSYGVLAAQAGATLGKAEFGGGSTFFMYRFPSLSIFVNKKNWNLKKLSPPKAKFAQEGIFSVMLQISPPFIPPHLKSAPSGPFKSAPP